MPIRHISEGETNRNDHGESTGMDGMMKSHMWRSWSRQIVLFVCAALLCIGLTGSCSREPAGPPEKVTIACPRGLPPGLFYIAREKGFFQAAGVEVVFLPSIYGKAAIQNVIDGKADLARRCR